MVQMVRAGNSVNLVPSRLEICLIYIIGFVPAILYFWLGARNELGSDPVNVFERWLGLWAVRFLLLSLIITPLRLLTRLNLLRYRRTFGLLAFSYAVLHLLAYVGLDQGFDFGVLAVDVTKRPFVILGFVAFLLLTAMAVTSNRFSIRKLGRKWQSLHRVVYAGAILIAIHFLMAFKTYTVTSVSYAAVLLLLSGYRFWGVLARRYFRQPHRT